MTRISCLLFAAFALMLPGIAAAEEVTINIKAAPGLRFDPPRFTVPPGAKVKLVIENTDAMQHNLLVVQPGSREAVVTEAIGLGADGPKMEFVPKTPKVLHASKMLNPGVTQTLEFTAPSKEGVYPYVCTNVGHGFLMYGAMYVTRVPGNLPPEEKDPNLPPPLPQATVDHSQHHSGGGPRVQRTFMPDSGPASIAVDLGGGNSFCFDAGACRLRYAWTGGFIDAGKHLASSGDVFTEIIGRVWWRADDVFPLHIGAPRNKPKVAWHGYRLIDGLPELRYSVDGVVVREMIKPRAGEDGGGLLRQFTLESPGQDVYFVAEPGRGAKFESATGEWRENVLKLTAEQGRQFTIVMKPQPGVLPLAYWSMNDSPHGRMGGTVPGVVGPAVTFDGKKQKQMTTRLNLKDLAGGGTILLWVKLDAKQKQQVILGAKNDKQQLVLGYQMSDKPALDLRLEQGRGKADASVPIKEPGEWTPIALVFDQGSVRMLAPGSEVKVHAEPIDATLSFGSIGGKQMLKGAIDEVRVYDRVLSDSEIRQIFDREVPGNKEVRR